LVRRGIELSALMGAMFLVEGMADAAVPGPLRRAAVRIGLLASAGQGAGKIPSHIAAMASGAARALFLTRVKTALVLLCAGGVLTGGGILTRAIAAKDRPTPVVAAPATFVFDNASLTPQVAPAVDLPESLAARDINEAEAVRGRVLDPDGKPLSGVNLFLFGKEEKSQNLGASGDDGAFTIIVPKGPHYLVAVKEGTGLDFIQLGRNKTVSPIELRLVRDNVIRGRVVDTEGKPITGVKVVAKHIGVYGGSADPLLAEWKTRHFQSGLPHGIKHLWLNDGSIMPAATSGTDGSFVVSGTGIERLVTLRLQGAGIADAEAWIVNRPGFDPKPYNEAARNNIPKGMEGLGAGWLLNGSEFSIIAEAEKPIRGVVTGADTGKGRPGVEVALTRSGEDLVGVVARAKTDANGRYELHGARKLKSYMLEVKADSDTGYMSCQERATDTPGYEPITIDIRLVKGVVITGRVMDKSTGKAIPGFATIGVLSDNSFAKTYPEFDHAAGMYTERTKDDGTFRIVTIPGPILLMGGPDYNRVADWATDAFVYRPAAPDPKYPQYFGMSDGYPLYYTVGGARSLVQGEFCKVLKIEPGSTVVKHDIVLERASALPIMIRDNAGQPINGTWATGISAVNFVQPVRLEKSTCFAYHVEPGKRRVMAFYEPNRRIFGSLVLNGDGKTPIVAKLGRPARLKARLVSEAEKPLAGCLINVYYSDRQATEIYNHAHRAQRIVTDADGAFQLEDMIPDLPFKLYHEHSSRVTFRANLVAEKAFTAKAGELLDLGNLKVKPARDE
jgi:hypothetical protein